MIDANTSLLPFKNKGNKLNAFCVELNKEKVPSESEIVRLLSTLDFQSVMQESVTLRHIDPKTYISKGKVEIILEKLATVLADVIVIDAELSPNQLRNLEKVFGKPTIDRPGVIIEIFSNQARTREAKTQVELARLQYLLPRLAHFWSHFERQRGGIGLKGMGEKQIEVDRRLIKKRMALLQKRLKSVAANRQIQRAGRTKFLKVALVGYTNAGKSTLLNALTHSDVKVEDKLFSTLDSSARALDPHSQPPIVAIDTVGFIDRLPTSLIASFRSTLEELHHADLLLHVVDASSENAKLQIQVTEKTLEELGLDKKPRLIVLNKIDKIFRLGELNKTKLLSPGAIRISAMNSNDTKRLRDLILTHFKESLELLEIVIPYHESKLDSLVRAHGSIEKTKYLNLGTFYRLRMSKEWAGKLQLKKFSF